MVREHPLAAQGQNEWTATSSANGPHSKPFEMPMSCPTRARQRPCHLTLAARGHLVVKVRVMGVKVILNVMCFS